MSTNSNIVPETYKVPDRYFTPAEVEMHNSESDLWLSWFGHVYDLTNLSKQYKGKNQLILRGYTHGSYIKACRTGYL